MPTRRCEAMTSDPAKLPRLVTASSRPNAATPPPRLRDDDEQQRHPVVEREGRDDDQHDEGGPQHRIPPDEAAAPPGAVARPAGAGVAVRNWAGFMSRRLASTARNDSPLAMKHQPVPTSPTSSGGERRAERLASRS